MRKFPRTQNSSEECEKFAITDGEMKHDNKAGFADSDLLKEFYLLVFE